MGGAILYSITVNDQCTGCGICISTCPFGALEMMEKRAVVNAECTMCGACVPVCPVNAIDRPLPGGEQDADLNSFTGVWIFAEQKHGHPLAVTFELIGEGRKIADQLGEELWVVLLGHNLTDAAEVLARCPVDSVLTVDDELLADYHDERYAYAITRLVQKYQPAILLMGGTTNGRSLAPRVAVRLGTGLTADCTGLEVDMERRCLLQTRPAMGGNIMATIVCQYQRPQMATVRPKVFPRIEPGSAAVATVVRENLDLHALPVQVRLIEKVEEMLDTIPIDEADIVVSGGRGIGSKENYQLIEELAHLLGGAAGASRAVVDEGWAPYARQVGQTGRTVSPKIYIACGISGAVQHIIGMRSADTIIAINRNPDAPIFQIADYGIVGDVKEILTELIKTIKMR
jgi:electron transfer flavoprotein alpha subunit